METSIPEALRSLSTPTVSNAIELFNVRPRAYCLLVVSMLSLLMTSIAFVSAAPNERGSKPIRGNAQRPPETIRLQDLEGRMIDPFQPTNVTACVFIFLSNECPIANRYAPEIRRLYTQFASNGIAFWLVHPDPDESAASIAKHMKEYQFTCGVLRDPEHLLVKRAKAHVTPEAAVFGAGGQLLYHGRIDNRYVEFGKARPAATQHDLQKALEAIAQGKRVPITETRAVGCYIPKLP